MSVQMNPSTVRHADFGDFPLGVLGAKRRHDFRRLVGVHGVPLRRIRSADELVKFSLGTIDDIGHGLAGCLGLAGGFHVLF